MAGMTKAAIIGAGHVGSHVALDFLMSGLFDEIVLIDIDEKKAHGHADDLADRLPLSGRQTRVRAGGYADIADAQLAVVCACGTALFADRLLELSAMVAILDDIGGKLGACGFSGVVLSISNPCDVVARYLAQQTGLRVIGTGTLLDSARLRRNLARALGVAPASVQAFCLGEHGDSQVAAFSRATVGGVPLGDYPGAPALNLPALAKETADAGWQVVLGKGCTEFAIAAVATTLARAILGDEKWVLPCSTMLHGEYGVAGVYASVLCVVGAGGVLQTIEAPISSTEQAAFQASCRMLEAAFQGIG
ncbi:MAG: hypothetical protein LBN04_03130 [Oscillospiraceae bacterium]|jgi:L-lactate dehydrogenase|nr:hypothetical protein [Oscillospiraceae bacterium]